MVIAFAGQDGFDPFRRPGLFDIFVDPGERLQSHGFLRILRERAAEIMPVAAHGERRRPDRAAEIEGKNLRAGIAAKLQGHQRQQHAFAGAGRPNDQSVADVADMERETEGRRAFRPGKEQRRRIEMIIARRPGPDRRERHHMGKVQGRDRRLPDIGVDVTRQGAEPGLDRIHRLMMQVKSRPSMTFSTSRSFSSAMPASSSQTVTVAVT